MFAWVPGRRKFREHYLNGDRRDKSLTDKEQMALDLVRAFDRIEELRVKLWMTAFVLGIAGATIRWLASALMHCVHP